MDDENKKSDVETTDTSKEKEMDTQEKESKVNEEDAQAKRTENKEAENKEAENKMDGVTAAQPEETSDTALDAMKQQYTRLQADFANYKKRTASEKLQISEVVKMDILTGILPIIDNFERALCVPKDQITDDIKSFLDGYQMIYNQLMTVLKKEGLQKIDAVGKPFDPNYHQAVMRTPSDEYEDDIVIEVLQEGYLLGEKTLRPAMVRVAFNG